MRTRGFFLHGFGSDAPRPGPLDRAGPLSCIMSTRATGTRKNIILTVWLLLPILVVGLLIAGIFITYKSGRKMEARPIGQGRADTGGANALGEWLAGNDPNETERMARDLREGRLIDPLDWPAGVVLKASPRNTSVGVHWVFSWQGENGPPPAHLMTFGYSGTVKPGDATDTLGHTFAAQSFSHQRLVNLFTEGRPGAGFYVSSTQTVSTNGARLFDADGKELERFRFELIPSEDVTDGEPIEIIIPLGDE